MGLDPIAEVLGFSDVLGGGGQCLHRTDCQVGHHQPETGGQGDSGDAADAQSHRQLAQGVLDFCQRPRHLEGKARHQLLGQDPHRFARYFRRLKEALGLDPSSNLLDLLTDRQIVVVGRDDQLTPQADQLAIDVDHLGEATGTTEALGRQGAKKVSGHPPSEFGKKLIIEEQIVLQDNRAQQEARRYGQLRGGLFEVPVNLVAERPGGCQPGRDRHERNGDRHRRRRSQRNS